MTDKTVALFVTTVEQGIEEIPSVLRGDGKIFAIVMGGTYTQTIESGKSSISRPWSCPIHIDRCNRWI
jgi:hypothetical protein